MLPEVPKSPPLDAPLEAGVPKENDMAKGVAVKGIGKLGCKSRRRNPPATNARM